MCAFYNKKCPSKKLFCLGIRNCLNKKSYNYDLNKQPFSSLSGKCCTWIETGHDMVYKKKIQSRYINSEKRIVEMFIDVDSHLTLLTYCLQWRVNWQRLEWITCWNVETRSWLKYLLLVNRLRTHLPDKVERGDQAPIHYMSYAVT